MHLTAVRCQLETGQVESDSTLTAALLHRWHEGDASALATIVERERSWVTGYVRRHMGPALRSKAETQDIIHEALLKALRDGPRFLVGDRQMFRGLMGKIVLNVVRDQGRRVQRQCRALGLERPLPSTSVVHLDASLHTSDDLIEVLDRERRRAWVRLALEFLDPDDRAAILLRDWHELTFVEIAQRMGLREDAARMRYTRALPKLASALERLRHGDVEAMLESEDK